MEMIYPAPISISTTMLRLLIHYRSAYPKQLRKERQENEPKEEEGVKESRTLRCNPEWYHEQRL